MGASSSSRIEVEQRFIGLRSVGSQTPEDTRKKLLEKPYWEPIWKSNPTLNLEELNNFIDSAFISHLLFNLPECLNYLINQVTLAIL